MISAKEKAADIRRFMRFLARRAKQPQRRSEKVRLAMKENDAAMSEIIVEIIRRNDLGTISSALGVMGFCRHPELFEFLDD